MERQRIDWEKRFINPYPIRTTTSRVYEKLSRHAWVAMPDKCVTLDLISGLDLKVVSSSSALLSMLGRKPT